MEESVDLEFFCIDQILKIQIKAGYDESVEEVKRDLDLILAVILYEWSHTIGQKTKGLESKDDDQEFIDGLRVLQVRIGKNVYETNKPCYRCCQIQYINHAANNENCHFYNPGCF
jgi:hypothetical protein